MRIRKLILFALVILLLTGCVAEPAPTEAQEKYPTFEYTH